MAQCFHRFSWHLPSVLKKSKLCMSLQGRGRSRWSGQGVLWATSWCCSPGLGEPRMPGTCGLSELWACWHCSSRLNHKKQTNALECQCRQREGIKPAGNVMGFFPCYCSFLTPVICLKNGLKTNCNIWCRALYSCLWQGVVWQSLPWALLSVNKLTFLIFRTLLNSNW